MEYLEGCDLARLVERDGVLPISTSVDYVLQACEALAEAHAVGIVHRDIKPSNLFLTKRIDGSPCIKVLDFGISKAMHSIDASQPDFGMTRTQSVLGSPQYMAPEQMRSSKRVDGRTDIWAIGTIMHELLTGRSPFVAQTMPELFAMILTDPTPTLRERRSDVPDELDLVVQRCLEKDPERRYPNVLEVARALAPFASTPKADSIERIVRVTRNASQSMETAAASGSNPSMPELLVAPPLTPSAPLQYAKTTVDPVPPSHREPEPEPSPKRGAVTLVLAGLALLGTIGVGLVAFSLAKGRPSTSAYPPPEASAITSVAAAVTTTVSAAPVDPPPEDPPALPTASAAVSAEPSASAPAANAPPLTTARVRGHGPSVRTTALPPPDAPAPATTPTTKPATTATSRYD
jgi:serine/threonine-protein kinase